MTAWSIISETAALRRDGASFAKVLLILQESRNICVPGSTAHAQYRYWTRFFDEICVAGVAVLYLCNDKLHRIDGPAVEYTVGNKIWLLDDRLHRIDGPAIEYVDGTKEWWVYGIKMEGPNACSSDVEV